jgi:hypothetical protein
MEGNTRRVIRRSNSLSSKEIARTAVIFEWHEERTRGSDASVPVISLFSLATESLGDIGGALLLFPNGSSARVAMEMASAYMQQTADRVAMDIGRDLVSTLSHWSRWYMDGWPKNSVCREQRTQLCQISVFAVQRSYSGSPSFSFLAWGSYSE